MYTVCTPYIPIHVWFWPTLLILNAAVNHCETFARGDWTLAYADADNLNHAAAYLFKLYGVTSVLNVM